MFTKCILAKNEAGVTETPVFIFISVAVRLAARVLRDQSSINQKRRTCNDFGVEAFLHLMAKRMYRLN